MRFNLHARIEIAAIGLLLLGSCDGPSLSEKQRDEVEDIADSVVSDNDKVHELQGRIEALEQKLNM